MKRNLIKAIIIVTILASFALSLGGCKKKPTDPSPAETQKPAILVDEGEIEIEIPDGQDTFGE